MRILERVLYWTAATCRIGIWIGRTLAAEAAAAAVAASSTSAAKGDPFALPRPLASTHPAGLDGPFCSADCPTACPEPGGQAEPTRREKAFDACRANCVSALNTDTPALEVVPGPGGALQLAMGIPQPGQICHAPQLPRPVQQSPQAGTMAPSAVSQAQRLRGDGTAPGPRPTHTPTTKRKEQTTGKPQPESPRNIRLK